MSQQYYSFGETMGCNWRVTRREKLRIKKRIRVRNWCDSFVTCKLAICCCWCCCVNRQHSLKQEKFSSLFIHECLIRSLLGGCELYKVSMNQHWIILWIDTHFHLFFYALVMMINMAKCESFDFSPSAFSPFECQKCRQFLLCFINMIIVYFWLLNEILFNFHHVPGSMIENI